MTNARPRPSPRPAADRPASRLAPDAARRCVAIAAAALLVVVITGAARAQDAAPARTSRLVRLPEVTTATQLAALAEAGLAVDHVDAAPDGVELVVTAAEHAALLARGLRVELVAFGRPFAQIAAERGETVLDAAAVTAAAAGDGSVPAGYADLSGIEAQMAALAAAHPAICQLVDLTARYGTPPTHEGRHLLALKLSDHVAVDEDEPSVLVVSAHHCREIITPVIALTAATRLAEGHGVDGSLTALVDAHEIWIAPVWNPDGYAYVFTADNLWRKNRRPLTTSIGVDLNRNYPFGWSQTACDGSTLESSSTYKGPAPASEAETQTMLAFAAERHFTKLVDYHSSGREVLRGYLCSFDPLEAFRASEAVALSVASGYGGAERAPSAEGEHYQWELAYTGTHAFLIETATTFQPSFAGAQLEAELVWPGLLWMLERPVPISGHVTDACTNLPLPADVDVRSVGFVHGETLGAAGPFARWRAFLPSGGYELVFSAPGYVAQAHVVAVDAARAATLDVALEPVAPVTGCWSSGGVALAGTFGPPHLLGRGTLLPREPNELGLSSAVPGATAWLVAGASLLGAPFKGGVLAPSPDVALVVTIEADGGLRLPFMLPPGLPAGTTFHVQAWIADAAGPVGFAASNAVSAISG